MPNIKYTKFLTELYRIKFRDDIKTLASLIGGASRIINIEFNARKNDTYTKLEGRKLDRFRIVIGGGTIKEMANLPTYFSTREQMSVVIGDVTKAIKALANHELGHDIFTDMVSRLIIDYKDPKYIPFLHTVFNVLEDQVIEFNICLLYKRKFPFNTNPRRYFKFMIERLFMRQAEEYKDTGGQDSFLQYMLLMLRVGEAKIKNKCAIFEKYRADIVPLMKAVLFEPNGTKRIEKTITLCEWIIENIKEFSWEVPDLPEEEKVSGRMASGGKGIPVPLPAHGIPRSKVPSETGASKSADSEGVKSGGVEGSEEEEPSSEGTDAPEPKDEKEKEKEGEEESKEEGGGKAGGKKESDEEEDEDDDDESEEDEDEESPEKDEEESIVEREVDEEFYGTIFNDMIHDGDDHEWSLAKEDFEISNGSIIDDVNSIIEKNLSMITNISDFLTLFKGRIRPKDTDGFTNGRLSIRRAINAEMSGRPDTRIFRKRVARGRDADLAVYILADGSGSMTGSPSEIATKAVITTAQACEWASIPCEVATFTKTADNPSGISYTIVQKGFDDSFESSKAFLGISSSSMLSKLRKLRGVPTFRGNSEEVNLFYIWQKFKNVNHKTKLLFVMCDGMTTGSENNLKEVVTSMEREDNIIVIGIGIMCSALTRTYNHCKIFSNEGDLRDNLAPYLIETLSKYAK